MMRVGIGDSALANILSRQGAELRGQMQRAATEVATGRPVDLAQDLRGDLIPILAIDSSLARLAAFGTATNDLAVLTAAQQSAVTGLSDLVADLVNPLLSAPDFKTQAQIGTLAEDAYARLKAAVGLLNTQTAGRAIFSGVLTDRPPLGSAEDLLAALQTAAAGATTAGQVAAAIDDWFTDPGGYAAFYQGGAPAAQVPIAQGESGDSGTTALDPAIIDTLTGLSMAALLDLGLLAQDPDERARLAALSGERLLTSQESRVALSARIGTIEAQIDRARSRNSAEETALGILRSEMGSVDPYEAATRLEAARNQLEALYLVTARVSRLSLVEYLR